MEEILAKFGIKAAHLVTGIIGGAVGLLFGKPRKGIIAKLRAIITVIVGAVVTGYVTPLIFIWKPELETVEHAIAFVVGLFGMGVIEGVFNIISKFKTNPIESIRDLKKTIKGDNF